MKSGLGLVRIGFTLKSIKEGALLVATYDIHAAIL